MIKLTKIVQGLPSSVPFVGPETQERLSNKKFLSRLGANENVFGPSPQVVRSLKEGAHNIWMYSDPESHDLKYALAKHENTRVENIIVGEGIDGLLGYLCRLIVSSGVPVVTSQGAYPTFNFHVAGYGGILHYVPYKEDHEDLDSLLITAEQKGARLIYLANPDNPMGTFHFGAKVEDFISNLPSDVVLCLDEAYSEFVPRNELPRISPDNPQVIRMRTFSKGYGMAGARIGYAVGSPDLIKSFDKIRNHFGINSLSQTGALVALKDQTYLKEVIISVNESKRKIMDITSQCGLKPIPSFANFVAVDCGKDTAFANKVLNGLLDQQIFVRMPFVSPQSRCIRISAGKSRDLERLSAILPNVLEKVSSSKSSLK